MAFRSFSMKETDVKYMPKVGDRVQATDPRHQLQQR